VIEDFGCYARPFLAPWAREDRLMAGVYRCIKTRTHGIFDLYHFVRFQERLAKHGMLELLTTS
jgi:hypothetical protein